MMRIQNQEIFYPVKEKTQLSLCEKSSWKTRLPCSSGPGFYLDKVVKKEKL